MSKRFLFATIALVCFFGCDDSNTVPIDPPAFSGTISAELVDQITHVGLFQQGGDTELVVDLWDGNASPRTWTLPANGNWTINLPANTEDWDMFVLLGWQDNDGDGFFDYELEDYGRGHGNIDTGMPRSLWYFTYADSTHAAGWSVVEFASAFTALEDIDVWIIR